MNGVASTASRSTGTMADMMFLLLLLEETWFSCLVLISCDALLITKAYNAEGLLGEELLPFFLKV